MRTAQKFHDKGHYDQALPLLEELASLTRGTAHAASGSITCTPRAIYGMKDYILGGYYLDHFAKTFPTSQYAEECTFLTAMCHYKNSPAASWTSPIPARPSMRCSSS